MRRQSARSTPPLRTYPLQIHPALPPSSATPHLRSEACFVIHTHTHTPFQPIFDPAVHTHPAHLPLPASTSEALASPPSTHSPSFSSRRASGNLKGLAWIMPMTKRAAGVSWLWPSSRPCFEHIFSARACALSRNSVGPARTFEESKSRRKLANRKLVYALKRPRREAQKKSTNYPITTTKKAQTTNHDHKKRTKKTHKKAQTTNHDQKKKSTNKQKKNKLPITTTKKRTKKAQTTNHDHKQSTKKAQKKAQTTNHDHQKKAQKKHNKKHKLPITTTKKAQKSTKNKHKLPITTTKKAQKKHNKKHKLPITTTKKSTKKAQKTSTNYQSRPQKTHKKNTQNSTNYKSRPEKKSTNKQKKNKLPITTTKNAQKKHKLPITTTNKAQKKHKLPITTTKQAQKFAF